VQAADLACAFDSPWPAFDAARLHAVGLAQAGRATEALAVIEAYRGLVESDASPEQRGRFWADYAYVLNTARRLRDTAGDANQGITGAGVLNGNTATPTLTIGNVHVGSTTYSYHIANTGSTGPVLRGAIQTSVNGGNITDPRLSGCGVTAGN